MKGKGNMSWEPIKTAPKDGQTVLLWNKKWECPLVGYWDDSYDEHYWAASERMIADVIGAVERPTHWMFFPTPPR